LSINFIKIHLQINAKKLQFIHTANGDGPKTAKSSIFQDDGRHHLGFLKFLIFNARGGQDGGTASSCQILSQSLKLRPRYGDYFYFFSRRRPPSILGFVMRVLGSPEKDIWLS